MSEHRTIEQQGSLSVGATSNTDPVGGREKPQGEPPPPGPPPGSFGGIEEPLSSNPLLRFDLTTRTRGMESWEELTRDPDGEWVRYDDVKAEIERLTAELALIQTANVDLTYERDGALAERDRLREEAKGAAAHIAALGDLRDRDVAEISRLRAAQAEAVRILSAIEFDGQAYDAIQSACKLLAGAAEPNKLETVQQNKLNAALNIGQEIGHAKRTADETTRCQHGRELAGCIECYRAELNGEASLP